MSEWERDDSGLTLAQIERRHPYKHQGHVFVARRRLPKPVCSGCGLLLLRNSLTAWCERMGCNYADHPAYRATVSRLGTAAAA